MNSLSFKFFFTNQKNQTQKKKNPTNQPTNQKLQSRKKQTSFLTTGSDHHLHYHHLYQLFEPTLQAYIVVSKGSQTRENEKKLSYNLESFQGTKFLSFAAFFFFLLCVANSNSMANCQVLRRSWQIAAATYERDRHRHRHRERKHTTQFSDHIVEKKQQQQQQKQQQYSPAIL